MKQWRPATMRNVLLASVAACLSSTGTGAKATASAGEVTKTLEQYRQTLANLQKGVDSAFASEDQHHTKREEWCHKTLGELDGGSKRTESVLDAWREELSALKAKTSLLATAMTKTKDGAEHDKTEEAHLHATVSMNSLKARITRRGQSASAIHHFIEALRETCTSGEKRSQHALNSLNRQKLNLDAAVDALASAASIESLEEQKENQQPASFMQMSVAPSAEALAMSRQMDDEEADYPQPAAPTPLPEVKPSAEAIAMSEAMANGWQEPEPTPAPAVLVEKHEAVHKVEPPKPRQAVSLAQTQAVPIAKAPAAPVAAQSQTVQKADDEDDDDDDDDDKQVSLAQEAQAPKPVVQPSNKPVDITNRLIGQVKDEINGQGIKSQKEFCHKEKKRETAMLQTHKEKLSKEHEDATLAKEGVGKMDTEMNFVQKQRKSITAAARLILKEATQETQATASDGHDEVLAAKVLDKTVIKLEKLANAWHGVTTTNPVLEASKRLLEAKAAFEEHADYFKSVSKQPAENAKRVTQLAKQAMALLKNENTMLQLDKDKYEETQEHAEENIEGLKKQVEESQKFLNSLADACSQQTFDAMTAEFKAQEHALKDARRVFLGKRVHVADEQNTQKRKLTSMEKAAQDIGIGLDDDDDDNYDLSKYDN